MRQTPLFERLIRLKCRLLYFDLDDRSDARSDVMIETHHRLLRGDGFVSVPTEQKARSPVLEELYKCPGGNRCQTA